MIHLLLCIQVKTSIGAKRTRKVESTCQKCQITNMLDIGYGVAHSLNYAVARISTKKAKSPRIRVYGITHFLNYAVTSSRLREILTYEGYAITHYGVTA